MAYPILERSGQDLETAAPGGAVNVRTGDVDQLLELGANPESSAPGSPLNGSGGERRDNVAMLSGGRSGDPYGAPAKGSEVPAPPSSDGGFKVPDASGGEDLDNLMKKGDSYDRGLKPLSGGGSFGGGGGGGGSSSAGGMGSGGAGSGSGTPFGLGNAQGLDEKRADFPGALGNPQAAAQVGKLRGLAGAQQDALKTGVDEMSKNRGNSLFDAEKKGQGGDGKGGGKGGALASLKNGVDTPANLKPNADALMNAKPTFTPPPAPKEKKEKEDKTLQYMQVAAGMINPLFMGVMGMFR